MATKNNIRPNPKTVEPEGQSLDIHALLALVRSRLWVVILFAILALAAGIAQIKRTPKMYTSVATIQVEQRQWKIVKDDITPDDNGSGEALQTLVQVLLSKSLLARVAAACELMKDPQFLPLPAKGGAGPSDNQIANRLTGLVSVNLRQGTRLIDIEANYYDPKMAQKIASAIVNQYVVQTLETKSEVTRETNGFLISEADKLKVKLEQSEAALQRYKETTGDVSLEDKQNIVVEKLKDLNSQVTTAKSTRMKIETDFREAASQNQQRPDALLALPSVAALPEIANLKNQLSTLESEFTVLQQRYQYKHPKFKTAQTRLQDTRDALNKALAGAPGLLQKVYDSALANEQKLEISLREQEKLALDLDRSAIPFNVLKREVETDRALYESILARMKQTAVSMSADSSNFRVVQAAMVPDGPSSPNSKKILGTALAGGVMAGFGLIFLLYFLDSSMRGVDEVESQLKVSVLTTIPNSKLNPASLHLVVERASESHEAEAFRSLRTTLSLGENGAGRIFLITSALPAEGKSLCALNLAAAFADQGLKTLLVDADLRRPQITRDLQPGSRKPGLAEFLQNTKSFDEVVSGTEVDELDFVGAGVRIAKPSDLVAGTGLKALLEAAAIYDRIIIDTAPIIPVSDALILCKDVDAVCLVVRASKTPRRLLLRTRDALTSTGVRLAGVILNRTPTRNGSGYNYYHYKEKYGQPVYGDKFEK